MAAYRSMCAVYSDSTQRSPPLRTCIEPDLNQQKFCARDASRMHSAAGMELCCSITPFLSRLPCCQTMILGGTSRSYTRIQTRSHTRVQVDCSSACKQVLLWQVDVHCQAQGALLRDVWTAGSSMTNGLTQRLVSQHAAATQRYA